MGLDLNLLPILYAVYETRSVGEAAQKLGMSQPGLSTALKRARTALGDPLFLRTARGMEPTARTRALIDPIRTILSLIENKVTAAPTFMPAESTDEFRFALTDIGEAFYLPALMRSMRVKAPNTTARSVSYKPRHLEQAMEEGEVDLAIGYWPDLKSGDIFQQLVGQSSYTCIMRADHPIRGNRLTLEQFSTLGHAVIQLERRSQEVFEQFLTRQKIQRKVVLRTSHFMSIPAIAAGTDLIVTVPRMLADVVVKAGGVKAVDTTFYMPKYDVKVYWHRTAHHDPKNQWLRRTLIEEFRQVFAIAESGDSARCD